MSYLSAGARLRHPQIVALNQDAFFRDVRNVDREFALVEDVAEGDVHAALGREADTRLFACLVKVPVVVEIEL